MPGAHAGRSRKSGGTHRETQLRPLQLGAYGLGKSRLCSCAACRRLRLLRRTSSPRSVSRLGPGSALTAASGHERCRLLLQCRLFAEPLLLRQVGPRLPKPKSDADPRTQHLVGDPLLFRLRATPLCVKSRIPAFGDGGLTCRRFPTDYMGVMSVSERRWPCMRD